MVKRNHNKNEMIKAIRLTFVRDWKRTLPKQKPFKEDSASWTLEYVMNLTEWSKIHLTCKILLLIS